MASFSKSCTAYSSRQAKEHSFWDAVVSYSMNCRWCIHPKYQVSETRATMSSRAEPSETSQTSELAFEQLKLSWKIVQGSVAEFLWGLGVCGQTWSAEMLGMSKLDCLCKVWAITPPQITVMFLRGLSLGSQGVRKARAIKSSPSKHVPSLLTHLQWTFRSISGVHRCLGCQSWHKRGGRSCC